MRGLSLWLAALALILCGCSQPDQAQSTVASSGEGKPALWQVSDDEGGAAWLFGTVHLLPPDTQWQGPKLDNAMAESRLLVLEVSGLDDEQAVAKIFANLGVRAGLPPLSSRIAPDLRPKLSKAIRSSKVPPFVLDRMESWAATLTLAASQSAGLGLESASGVEQILTLRFTADEKPITGLETISEQLGLFDGLPEPEQRSMLNATIRNADGNQEAFELLFHAWLNGDEKTMIAGSADGLLASPLVRERLLDGRNRNWAAQIAKMIERQSHPFIAVGAAHIPGPNGVAQLLRAERIHRRSRAIDSPPLHFRPTPANGARLP